MNLFDYQLAEIEVSYSHRVPARDRLKVTCSADADKVFRLFWPSLNMVEYFYALFLNQNSQVLGFHQISKGGLTGTVADPQFIAAIAIKTLSRSIVVAHNHPSGNLQPSEADRALTRKIAETCRIIGIRLSDHLIITADSYYSMADNGEF